MTQIQYPVFSNSVAETRGAGADFVKSLRAGDVVALEGELGSGKTEFVRGACEALGIAPSMVTSPTFTIVNEYAGGQIPVFHMDAYRLESETEFYDLGYEDYFSGQAICFVEWPGKLPTILAGDDVIRLRFEHLGDSRRTIQHLDEG